MRTEDGTAFLEIVLVIFLIGLLTVVTLPQLQGYQSSRDLRHTGRQLGGDTRLTQQYAIAKDENFRLEYVTAPARFIIRKVSDNSVIKEVALPATVAVTSTFTSDRVEFLPTGAPTQSGAFCLSQSSNKMKVDVLPATGRV